MNDMPKDILIAALLVGNVVAFTTTTVLLDQIKKDVAKLNKPTEITQWKDYTESTSEVLCQYIESIGGKK